MEYRTFFLAEKWSRQSERSSWVSSSPSWTTASRMSPIRTSSGPTFSTTFAFITGWVWFGFFPVEALVSQRDVDDADPDPDPNFHFDDDPEGGGGGGLACIMQIDAPLAVLFCGWNTTMEPGDFCLLPFESNFSEWNHEQRTLLEGEGGGQQRARLTYLNRLLHPTLPISSLRLLGDSVSWFISNSRFKSRNFQFEEFQLYCPATYSPIPSFLHADLFLHSPPPFFLCLRPLSASPSSFSTYRTPLSGLPEHYWHPAPPRWSPQVKSWATANNLDGADLVWV